MDKRTIYGPPGTGKTTELMRLLEKELEVLPAEKIAFVSYTKQGTYEGVERAVKKFKLTKDQTIHFRTIHSLCFRAMGLHKTMMIGKQQYKLLSEKTGIAFTGYYSSDYTSTNDVYLHALSMRLHNPTLYTKMIKNVNGRLLNYVDFQFSEMKKQLGMIDFDDMLTHYLDHGDPLDVSTAFIDEGQDLTPLQWKVVAKLFSNADKVIVAGDDDQAVYEWSGADVTKFLNFSSKSKVLGQSYRLPLNILNAAKVISGDIGRRKRKEFSTEKKKGSLTTIGKINKGQFKGGELVLARTNWLLKQLSMDFAKVGIPYLFKGRPSIQKQVINAIVAHQKFEQGITEIKDLLKHKSHFSSLAKVPWQKTINLPEHKVLHYENVLLKQNLDKDPVKFETFHSSKGSENKHVFLSPELSKKVKKAMVKHYDAEMRCLYVGMTRTEQDLTLILPQSTYFYPNKYFAKGA